MPAPNFSEFQLQQAVNTAYTRYIYEKHHRWMYPIVPSLVAEFNLGWDSAFYFPWLHKTHPNPEGCNFFIQYKLSDELTTKRAKEWQFWNSKYFRFKIPYQTRDNNGNLIDDYNQWDCLKELANQNYPTFYATNHTLCKDALLSSFENGTLLDEIPFLDVRNVNSHHKHVTFTQNSNHFCLNRRNLSRRVVAVHIAKRKKPQK